jgi:hypothetical protein
VGAVVAMATAIAIAVMETMMVMVLVGILWRVSLSFYCIVHIKYDED